MDMKEIRRVLAANPFEPLVMVAKPDFSAYVIDPASIVAEFETEGRYYNSVRFVGLV